VSFEQNQAALTRAVEAWNSGDVGAYLDMYNERIKLHAGPYDFPDKSSVAEMYRGFFAATSDLVLTIDEAFGDGDRLCARYTVTGKHTGELMGVPPTGADISIIGITVMHFQNGRVLERWDIDDSAELFARLRGVARR
jgi:predicted ester cyclase